MFSYPVVELLGLSVFPLVSPLLCLAPLCYLLSLLEEGGVFSSDCSCL
jgi:hypothetical protein